MAEGGDKNGKVFTVTNDRGRKLMIGFEQFSKFEEACKQRFGYSEDMQVIFETDDEERTEVDKSAFAHLENKSKLRIRNVQDAADEKETTVKTFLVTDEQHGNCSKVPFAHFADFEKDCKSRFGYESDDVIAFISENERIQIGEDSFRTLASGTKGLITSKLYSGSDAVDENETIVKTFLVTDEQHGKCSKVPFTHFADFEKECKSRFGYESDDVIAFTSENKHIEIGEDSFRTYASGTKIFITPKLYSGSEVIDDDLQQQPSDASSRSKPEIGTLTTGAEYIRSELSRRGIDNLEDILKESMNIPLRPLSICVTGESGQGKSLLINAMRGLSPGDDRCAPVGIKETTLECTSYVHREYKDIVFWDVPGAGTKRFRKDEYLSKIGFEKYDFYIICSATRFSENDNWLLNEVIKQGKRCFFVRTKIDIDISNSKLDLGEGFDEDKLKETIRQDCEGNLNKKCPVFLINSHERFQYDFPKFMNGLIKDAPLEQQRSLVYVLDSLSTEIIEKKAVLLKSEVSKIALMLTVLKDVPPFYNYYIQGVISTYERHFELTEDHIKRYAEMMSVPLDELKREAKLKVDINNKSFLGTIMNVLFEFMEMKPIKISGGSSIIATGSYASYCLTACNLMTFIDDMARDAKSIFTSGKQQT